MSAEAVAILLPSGEKTAWLMASVCALQVSTSSPLSRSNSDSVPSAAAVASTGLDGAKLAHRGSSSWTKQCTCATGASC